MMCDCAVATGLLDSDERVRGAACSSVGDRDKDAEILVLRHQVAVLERKLGGKKVPVGCQNSVTDLDLVFYAAWWYSLMRPPKTGRRLIRSWERSAADSPYRSGWS